MIAPAGRPGQLKKKSWISFFLCNYSSSFVVALAVLPQLGGGGFILTAFSDRFAGETGFVFEELVAEQGGALEIEAFWRLPAFRSPGC